MGEFKPEYAGKMNIYLSAVDDMLEQPMDQPTIGVSLCKGKNQVTVEYALRDSAKPMDIAEFRHLEALPEGLKGSLPTIEEIEPNLERPKSLRAKTQGGCSPSWTSAVVNILLLVLLPGAMVCQASCQTDYVDATFADSKDFILLSVLLVGEPYGTGLPLVQSKTLV
jgi:hypothetical protein